MSTFEATRSMRVQRHFEILEIELPVITGACTIGSSPGYGTPLYCDQSWSGEYKTYYFTNEDAPILPSINGEPIWRCIKKIKETPTELKPGKGLSSRGSLVVTMSDFNNQDPNEYAPAVDETVKNQGTYLGKMSERQIFENKKSTLGLYRVEPDGTIDIINGGQKRYYISNAFRVNSNTGDWSLECKDVLSLASLEEKSWPISAGGFLRQDVDAVNAAIPVDGNTDYSTVFAVRIGDEFMEVLSVDDNLTPLATLNVKLRGSSIYGPTSGVLLTKSFTDEHDAGDEVFICELSDDEAIDSFIARVLIDSDLGPALIPYADWAAEVLEWHNSDKINTLHSESESVNKVLNMVLTGYLMDLWFSTVDNEVKLSAITVHKESSATLTEGKEINSNTLKKSPQDSLRASRALVLYDKSNLADNDDTPSYKKASQFSDPLLISDALYGKHKDKQFDNNPLLSKDAADLLTQRYVSRFKFTPFLRTWETEERALNFNTGDVVDIISTSEQGPSGLSSGNVRGQVTSIKPQYSNEGRSYLVSALTYEAAFNSGSEIVLNSTLSEVNLFILAGAPSQPIELTFVLDGAHSEGNVAIRAGAFAAGSKIIMIMVNGFDGQANGGDGGQGESIASVGPGGTIINQVAPPKNGVNGGIVYDSQGVDTDIYFSGATPSASYPIADGYIRAPSGGSGGFNRSGPFFDVWLSGDGGDGGDGRKAGVGGLAGTSSGPQAENGTTGSNGEIDGTGTGWGLDGNDNDALRGLAGSGVVDSGAIVNLFADGDLATRYINGNGSHP